MTLKNVFLVIIFRVVESLKRQQFRRGFFLAKFRHFLPRRLQRFPLLLIGVPKRGLVLRLTNVTDGIVRIPKQFDNFLKRDFLRTEVDFNRFCVMPQVVVSRINFLTTGISDSRSVDTFDDPKLGVRSPKSAQSKRRRLKILWQFNIYRRLGHHALLILTSWEFVGWVVSTEVYVAEAGIEIDLHVGVLFDDFHLAAGNFRPIE